MANALKATEADATIPDTSPSDEGLLQAEPSSG